MPAGDKDIEPAVVVHVEKRRAPPDQRQAGLAEMRWHGDIFESTRSMILISQVAIKRVGLVGKFGDEHREASAVVVIAPSHAHRSERLTFTVQRNASDHCLVTERPIAIVVKEMIRSGVIGDEKIGPAVVVVVTPGCPQSVIFFGIVDTGFL